MERNLEKMVKNLSIQLSVGMDCKLQDRKIASMEVNRSAIQNFVAPRCAIAQPCRVTVKGVATCAKSAKSAKNAKSTIPFTIFAMTFSPWYFWHWPLLLLELDMIM
jgi:hypothetical protein